MIFRFRIKKPLELIRFGIAESAECNEDVPIFFGEGFANSPEIGGGKVRHGRGSFRAETVWPGSQAEQ